MTRPYDRRPARPSAPPPRGTGSRTRDAGSAPPAFFGEIVGEAISRIKKSHKSLIDRAERPLAAERGLRERGQAPEFDPKRSRAIMDAMDASRGDQGSFAEKVFEGILRSSAGEPQSEPEKQTSPEGAEATGEADAVRFASFFAGSSDDRPGGSEPDDDNGALEWPLPDDLPLNFGPNDPRTFDDASASDPGYSDLATSGFAEADYTEASYMEADSTDPSTGYGGTGSGYAAYESPGYGDPAYGADSFDTGFGSGGYDGFGDFGAYGADNGFADTGGYADSGFAAAPPDAGDAAAPPSAGFG
ncbi:hypothetical protein [Streptomyces sp. NPDC050546]|uniref:hypothetical protein n=1 Tax=Streptomyces sp. NPDC050546 TaxID=3365628 RepID=UPI00379E4EB3